MDILEMNKIEDKYSRKRKIENIIGRADKKGKIEDILDYFVRKEWIKGYNRVIEGTDIVGVEIVFEFAGQGYFE